MYIPTHIKRYMHTASPVSDSNRQNIEEVNNLFFQLRQVNNNSEYQALPTYKSSLLNRILIFSTLFNRVINILPTEQQEIRPQLSLPPSTTIRERRALLPDIINKNPTTILFDDVKAKPLFSDDCIQSRKELSLSKILHTIGQTLKNPIKNMAIESQVVYLSNRKKSCPSVHDVKSTTEITLKFDALISSIMSLLPGSKNLYIAQNIVGDFLDYIADEIDGDIITNDEDKIRDINDQILFLSKSMLANMDVQHKSSLYHNKKPIKINGIRKNNNNKIFITIDHDGVKKSIPVEDIDNKYYFKHPDGKISHVSFDNTSKTWSLGKGYSPRGFEHKKNIIARYKLSFNEKYSYSEQHHELEINHNKEKIYRIKTNQKKINHVSKNDLISHELDVIELHNEILPIRSNKIENHGISYHIYDINTPQNSDIPVEWENNRWEIQSSTCNTLHKKLKNLLNINLCEKKILSSDLSTPDKNGIQWNNKNTPYIRYKRKYIRLYPYDYGTQGECFMIKRSPSESNLHIVIKDNKIHLESYRERLKKIKTIGLCGLRQNKIQANKIVRDFFKINKQESNQFLAKYQFEKKGMYSKKSFARHIENYNEIPAWSERYLIINNKQKMALDDILSLGEIVDSGAFGIVYTDKSDPNNFIKLFRKNSFSRNLEMAHKETELFNRYYGEDSARVIIKDSKVYMKMLKIPGEKIYKIPANQLPDDLIERFIDMLDNLSRAGIWHDDLHTGNVLFDTNSGYFYPLDLSNAYDTYHLESTENKIKKILDQDNDFNDFMQTIKRQLNLKKQQSKSNNRM